MSSRNANYFEHYNGIVVRVMCPECGVSGGQPLASCQPKCHKCKDDVLMLPASNTKTECTWAEAIEYSKKLL